MSDDEDEPQIRTAADPALVNEIKSRLKALGKMQREVARDIGVSEGILSQYMNGATRSNGWRSIETKLNEWLDASAAMTPVNVSVNCNTAQSSDAASAPRLKRRKIESSSDATHDDHSGTSSPTREVGAVAPRRIVPLDQSFAAFNLSQLTVVMPTSQPIAINHNNHWINQSAHVQLPQHMSPVTSSEEPEVSSSYELHEFYAPTYNYEYMSPSALDLYVELTDDNVKQIVAESMPYYNNTPPVHPSEWSSSFAV